MHRLVAFGCSNTYGEALENPKEQAWPSVLAEMLNYECVNLSYPGSSPRYVIYKMQKFNFRKTDIVVVLWPEVSRYCCIQEDDSVKHIGIWYYSKGKTTKNLYEEMFTKKHAEYDFDLFDSYAKMLFNNKNIKYLDYVGPYFWLDKNKYKMELLDYGSDGRHPGVKSHKNFAQYVYKNIKE